VALLEIQTLNSDPREARSTLPKAAFAVAVAFAVAIALAFAVAVAFDSPSDS
jgi:hypothetical protein